jgi:predicted nucleic acid-binding protein
VVTVPTKVVDTSALAAFLFREPEADDVAARLEGARLLVPRVLDFELGNVCLTKLRRHPERHDELLTAYRWRSRIAVTAMSIDHDKVLDLAEQVRLSFYDASYLWLAREHDVELITLDRRLADTARRMQ